MTLLALLLTTFTAALTSTALTSTAHAADPSPVPTATMPAEASAPVSVTAPPSAAPSPAISANVINIPSGPTAKDKVNEYSARTTIQTCTSNNKDKCVIDTMVGAKPLGNQEITWERRIFFQHYDLEKPIDAQAITVKAVKLVGKKTLIVTNSRGDSFELEIGHGHLKRPKNAREYTK